MSTEADELRRIADAHDAEPEHPDADATILDDAPPTITRLLSLCRGRAYAVTWVHVQRLVRERKDKQGNVIPVDPPQKEVHLERVVVRDDGVVYSNAPVPDSKPLSKLPVEFHGTEIPPEHMRWSGAGLKRYHDGERPSAVSVFSDVRAVVGHFMDLSGSFSEERNLQELAAVWALNTYLLDAYSVVGYLWPNGEPGCGKTHLLDTLTTVSYLGSLILASGSFAAIRDMAGYGATLLFDDAEKIMDQKSGDPDKQALLLAGNRKGATVPIKVIDPANPKRWVTRHINAFCPRAFSAIGLPIDTMASRTIFIPLLASANSGKANSDPFDYETWPNSIDRRRLVDDLWALALASLKKLPAYDKRAAEMASHSGRALQPWRALLATALWLQEQGVEGLHDRMTQTMHAYRSDNLLRAMSGHRTVVIRALRRLADSQRRSDPDRTRFRFQTMDLWRAVNDVARDDGEEPDEQGYLTIKSVGWRLKRLRLSRPEGRRSSAREWEVTEQELERLETAAGIRVSVSGKTSQSTQTTETSPDDPDSADPSDVSDISDISDVLSESGTPPTEQPKRIWEYRLNGNWYRTGEIHAHLQTADEVAAALAPSFGPVEVRAVGTDCPDAESPNRKLLRDWLRSIGSPPEEIEETLELCSRDPAARKFYTRKAMDEL